MKQLRLYHVSLVSLVSTGLLITLINANEESNLTGERFSSDEENSTTYSSAPKRVAKDFLKSFNVSVKPPPSSPLNLTSLLQKRSPSPYHSNSNGKVQIIEAGARSRGEPRILRRGPFPSASTRFSDTHNLFTNRQNLNDRLNKNRNTGGSGGERGGGTYDSGSSTSTLTSSSLVESLGSFQVISIPGSDIPPPVYTYTGVSPPAPASIITATGTSGGGNAGSSHGGGWSNTGTGGGSGGSSGGGLVTPRPEIIPPRPTPHPKPIPPPNPGTSIPIIGGGPGTGVPIIGGGPGTSIPIIGGGSGGSLLIKPPAPPPDEIFPPAPPPDDEEDFLDDVGRRLKVGRGGSSASGVGLRTRTRVVPPSGARSSANSRFSKESLSVLNSQERPRGGSGGTMRRERLRDRVKEFKTSLLDEGDGPMSNEINPDDPNIITDFVFSDIKCFKTRQNEYFGATIHMKSGFHLPYIRDRPQDPLSSEECRLEQVDGSRGSYHMAVTDLRGCGVEQCGEAMCLTMVFPRVPILALADDEVTTIKCIPQKSTISDMKSISFAGDSTENRRSSSTVEGGIQEFVAEVGVFRQNPGSTNGLFVKRVNSGGVVQLGEPLQLRSVVRGTDGWKHSKLTDVKVWRMRDNFKQNLDNLDPNQASEVITLVDAHGCRNDEYVVIAEDHPIRDPRNDMVHHFTFKAFLFRGQRVNEPLIVTARVHACQELQDCFMECDSTRKRYKRSPIEHHNMSAIVHDFDSQLALRVVGLKDHPSSILDDDQFPFNYPSAKTLNKTGVNSDPAQMTCNEKMFASGLGGGCIMLLVCGLGLALFTYIKQGRNNQSNRKPSPSSSSSPVHCLPHPNRGGAARGYRYAPTPGRMQPHPPAMNPGPYQKPLPPTPVDPNRPTSTSNPSPTSASSASQNTSEISQVAKLLQELAKNAGNKENDGKKNSTGKVSNKNQSGKKKDQSSDYASIDETITSSLTSSNSSSEIDLSKAKANKDGFYILYCPNKEKNGKIKLPLSAPSSTRMKRKQIRGKGKAGSDDNDYMSQDEDSELPVSQDVTESDDSFEEADKNGKGGNLGKNQPIRRTVREVKKKSKQNNSLASTSGGIIRRRMSSVYREGYLSGLRGAVVAAVQDGSVPLRYRKSPSTGNLPETLEREDKTDHHRSSHPSTKRINFSVRERRSARKKRQIHPEPILKSQRQRHHSQSHQHQQNYEPIYSNSEAALNSDLDSAYSGSNCSKLTEDRLYELKRGSCGGNAAGSSEVGAGNGVGIHPDFRNSYKQKQKNLMDVQKQLRRSVMYNHNEKHQPNNGGDHNEQVNENFISNHNTTAISVGLISPPLPFGETKPTHFVTRDDSSTKILIVPETHV